MIEGRDGGGSDPSIPTTQSPLLQDKSKIYEKGIKGEFHNPRTIGIPTELEQLFTATMAPLPFPPLPLEYQAKKKRYTRHPELHRCAALHSTYIASAYQFPLRITD